MSTVVARGGVLAAGALTAVAAIQTAGGPRPNLAPAPVQAAPDRASLRFEPNLGQADQEVRFVARTPRASVFLTGDEAVIRLTRHELPPTDGPVRTGGRGRDGATSAVLRIRLQGANPAAQVSGLEEGAGTSNYLIGRDPSGWRTGIPAYSEVRYRGVYPGIDLVYHGASGGLGLEYDFVVAPGADPAVIGLAFEGQEGMSASDGALAFETPVGTVRQPAPRVYQDVDGSRRTVEGGYRLESGDRAAFAVAAYDRSRPLVIDPVLAYSSFLGGTGSDQGSAVAVDGAGSAYVAGITDSTDFPTSRGAYQRTKPGGPTACPGSGGCNAFFVSKFAPSGTLEYSTYLGARGNNGGAPPSIAVARGEAYIAGTTENADFPADATIGPLGASSNAFVATLSADGQRLLRSTVFGGRRSVATGGTIAANNGADALAVDEAGNAYVSGSTTTVDFPTTVGAFEPTPACSDCTSEVVYVAKLDTVRHRFAYSTYLDHPSSADVGAPHSYRAHPHGIAVDRQGDAVVVGETGAPDMPVTPGAYQMVFPHDLIINRASNYVGATGFVAELNPAGSLPVYASYLGSPFHQDPRSTAPVPTDVMWAPALDAAGDIYIAGTTEGTFPTTAGVVEPQRPCVPPQSSALCSSGVVVKLHPAGRGAGDLVLSTYLGALATPRGAAVGPGGDVYVSGGAPPNFPVTSPRGKDLRIGPASGPSTAFLTRLDPMFSSLLSSATVGGSGQDGGAGMAVDPLGSGPGVSPVVNPGVYIAGVTSSPDFPTTPFAAQPHLGSSPDAFALKVPLPKVTGVSPNTGPVAGGTAVRLTGSGLSDALAVIFGAATPASTVSRPCPPGAAAPQSCFVQVSDVDLTVFTPPHAPGLVDVTVVTPWGPSYPNPLGTATNPAGDQYLYGLGGGGCVGAACRGLPIVTGVQPPCIPLNVPQQVTVQGTGFGPSPATVNIVGLGPHRATSNPDGTLGVFILGQTTNQSLPVTVTTASGVTSAPGPSLNYSDKCTSQGGNSGPATLTSSAAAAEDSNPFQNGGFGVKAAGAGPFTPSPPGTAPALAPHPQPVTGPAQVPAPGSAPMVNAAPAPAEEEKKVESASESSHAMVRLDDPSAAGIVLVLMGCCVLPAERVARRRWGRALRRPAPAFGRVR